ncbi:TonB-dependent receptor [Ferruginibacter paludis]|uniref:TonB-dependent receptor n=1 Tax=Ferruginibacter paludis TaxID=1310417 RepID=UPI0025B46DC7|nr:TonB-dependent receptor [Ferruginibacter paludis]MDN3656702.1 TonB-dependent receptor [Ferruginibacter paludis]
MSGRITDEKGGIVSGASVQITHVPTGEVSKTQTNKNGIFRLTNLRPGGPYTIAISFVGFKDERAQDVNLSLGTNPDLNVVMKVNTSSLEAVVVTGNRRISGVTIGKAQLNTLPTIGRSLSDFTRLTPQSNNNSYAGTNFRYNNLTLDGAINNDAFGFSNSAGGTSGGGQSGTAGAGTRTTPYSIDVIQEVQVQLAPYDVKIGNFTGGSVNAVTKSGSNDFHGSVYGYGRNQALVGKSVDGLKSKIGSDFHDYQYGATVSGPLVKNKAFFIVNYEHTDKQEPSTNNIGDPGAAATLAEVQAIANQLKTKYDYDPGSYLGAYKIFTKSDKVFARLDFNLNTKNSLMLRAIYTDGVGNNLERSSNNFQFGSTDFTQHTKNLNLVAELKTRLSADVSNQLNVSYINVHEFRDFPGTIAPYIDIDNGRITLGTWREASIYNLKQHTVEISDNVTVNKGINKFTFGTHNEIYNLSYGFINSYNGRWEYSRGVNSFLADNPSRIRGAFITDPKLSNDRNSIYNNPPNPFSVALTSVYAQDEISVNKKFKLSPGVRLDYSFVGSQPYLDPALKTTNSAGYTSPAPTYTNTPFKDLTGKLPSRLAVSPRLGFNYDVKGDQSIIIRGGTGIFTGRVPFAWYGYAYTLNGGTYGNIDWNGPSGPVGSTPGQVVPLAINPQGLKDTVTKYGGASRSSTREIDVFDNNFKLPTVWRSSIAADFKFGNGYKFTVDALYTKTIYDVKYEQINLKDSVAYFSTGPTQIPVYVGGKYNSAFSNVYYLTNTKLGYRYNLTAQISKFTNNIKIGSRLFNMNWSAAYTYGMSKDITNGIRNSWESSYNVNPTNTPSNSPMAYSNFDLRNRIVATWSGNLAWNKTNITSLSFFYAGTSGSPYSLIYQSAPFGSGSNAPLPYIPRNQSDIVLVDKGSYTAAQQWSDLDAFISSDKYLNSRRGKYAERNGLRTPWNHDLDMKLMHEFRLSKTNKFKSLQLSLDIFNVLNLINSDWGHVTFVTNLNNYTVNFLQFVSDGTHKVGAPATGYVPSFNFVRPTGVNNHYYTVDPLNSRWQGQFGIKYNF